MATDNRTKRIQLFRNTTTLLDLKSVTDLWATSDFISKLKDGEQVLGRYKKTVKSDTGGTETEYHTLYGVAHITGVEKPYIEVFKNAAELQASINELDYTDKPVYNQYVKQVNQVDGKIAVERVDLPIKNLTDTVENGVSVLTGITLDKTNGDDKNPKNVITPTQRTIESSDKSINLDVSQTGKIDVKVTDVVTDNVLNQIKSGDPIQINKKEGTGTADEITIDLKYDETDFKLDQAEGTKGNLQAVPYTAADKSINITGKAVKVNLSDKTTGEASSKNILHLKEDGIFARLEIKDATPSKLTGNNILKQYNLIDTANGNAVLGDTITIYKDKNLVSVTLVDKAPTTGEIIQNEEPEPTDDWKAGQFLRFQYYLANGTTDWVYLDVSTFLTDAEYNNGLEVTNGVVSTKLTNNGGLVFDGTGGGKKEGIKVNNDNKSILVNSTGQVEVGTVDCGEY